MRKKIAILGSTGSIGSQALQVIQEHPEEYELLIITANNNAERLIQQAKKHHPKTVVIGNEAKYDQLVTALKDLPIEVTAGKNSVHQIVEHESIDIVLTAIVGYYGFIPTVKAIQAGKDIALANKETLVVAGEYITRLAEEKKVKIIPVDSEHSAIFQCLTGESVDWIEKIYLTASGGPFRGMSTEFLKKVTSEEALKHPNWDMGEKITIDSASMMNKGLEAIEAKWLFNLAPDQINVIVHPQSVIHSIVQFIDGSMKAQMGVPDMRIPIQYALGYPGRLKSNFKRFNFFDYPDLTFEQADTKKFRNLELSYEAMKMGGNMPCVLNAANEIAVEAFLGNKIGFLDMPNVIEKTLQKSFFIEKPRLEDYENTNNESRRLARSFL
jgi:1-deoxy-D-xylulose-5-phosphate reductoisomerase